MATAEAYVDLDALDRVEQHISMAALMTIYGESANHMFTLTSRSDLGRLMIDTSRTVAEQSITQNSSVISKIFLAPYHSRYDKLLSPVVTDDLEGIYRGLQLKTWLMAANVRSEVNLIASIKEGASTSSISPLLIASANINSGLDYFHNQDKDALTQSSVLNVAIAAVHGIQRLANDLYGER